MAELLVLLMDWVCFIVKDLFAALEFKFLVIWSRTVLPAFKVFMLIFFGALEEAMIEFEYYPTFY